LGAMIHELKHVLVEQGGIPPGDNPKRRAAECRALACELLFYSEIKASDPCYSTAVGAAARKAQQCKRMDETRKIARAWGCSF